MSHVPKISESEWEIMKVIWKQSPLTAEQIVLRLPGALEWSDQTVRTFINRLLKKNAIGFEKLGRSYLYYPLFSEKACIRAESQSFLKRVFNGAADTMLTNFLEETDLSQQELDKLHQFLTEKKERQIKERGSHEDQSKR